MTVENKVLYRDYAPINIMLAPLDIYNDTTAVLSSDQEQRLDIERNILKKFNTLDSVKKLLNLDNDSIVTINQYSQLIDTVKNDMAKNNLPISLLNYVYSGNEDGDNIPYMLPNNVLPVVSILSLKNAKNSYVYGTRSPLPQERWNLVEQYDTKAAELKDCKDEDFVAKNLEPLQFKIVSFDKAHKEEMQIIKQNEKNFYDYVSEIGLKEEFEIFESTQATPALAAKKTKRKM